MKKFKLLSYIAQHANVLSFKRISGESAEYVFEDPAVKGVVFKGSMLFVDGKAHLNFMAVNANDDNELYVANSLTNGLTTTNPVEVMMFFSKLVEDAEEVVNPKPEPTEPEPEPEPCINVIVLI